MPLPNQICVENKTTESVQLFTIKSKFSVKTLTALQDLVVADDCECLNRAPPPRHFVFLIDSSDSFNSGDSNSPDKSWFELTKKFLIDFIKQGNFASGPVSVSIYNFSGYSQGSAKYKPGSRGLIDSTNPSLGVHYRIEVDNIYLSNISKRRQDDLVKKIEGMDSLDGNGLMWLALQDMSLPAFQSGAKTAFARSGIVDPDIQNILIVITDTEWDLKGLKDTRGALAKEEVIIQSTKNSFNRVFALSGSQMDPLPAFVKSPDFQLAQMTTKREDLIFFGPKSFALKLDELQRKLFSVYKF